MYTTESDYKSQTTVGILEYIFNVVQTTLKTDALFMINYRKQVSELFI